ncbi:MAG TPA: zf-HC2 domain-containing protein [Gaiellaceae bacterium]|nr:zf-HC2 domain-containing protein [Gaiellaceae bacterium]
MTGFESICEKCEELIQPYLDRALDESERREAEAHLDDCGYCKKRYRFEADLRTYVRVACSEPMPPDLKARLAALRTPLL